MPKFLEFANLIPGFKTHVVVVLLIILNYYADSQMDNVGVGTMQETLLLALASTARAALQSFQNGQALK